MLPQTLEQLPATDAGEHDIQDDNLGHELLCQRQRLLRAAAAYEYEAAARHVALK